MPTSSSLPAACRSGRAGSRFLAVAAIAGALPALLGGASPPAQAATSPGPTPIPCPSRSAAPADRDFHGQTLTTPNFSGRDLRNASFVNATLASPMFIRADLRGANFCGATFVDSQLPQSAVLPADFTLAKLGGASFVNAHFNGLTYLTYADITSADFSATDISDTDKVVFGTRLTFTPADGTSVPTRPAFRGTVMSCDFVAQWPALDLSFAKGLQACAAQLKAFDFSGVVLPGADLSGLDLTGTRWAGAVLEGTIFENATLDNATGLSGTAGQPARLAGARFNKASLVGVDFSNAQLYGADFTYADLANANFAGSFLTAGGATHEPLAAKFDGARLRNVNFASAKLQSASFVSANLYGKGGPLAPSATCQRNLTMCGKIPVSGATCSCASMAGADLTSTDFSGAYLFGVDFSNPATVVNGTKFDNAILVASNFEGVNLRVASGAAASFKGAMLQGANLGVTATGLAGATLTGAYLDFESILFGNDVEVLLSSDHTRFRNWSGGQRICLLLGYDGPSQVPESAAFDCPDGSNGVCGKARTRAQGPNPRWASGTPLKSASPVPGWYANDATYDRATTDGTVCNGVPPGDRNW